MNTLRGNHIVYYFCKKNATFLNRARYAGSRDDLRRLQHDGAGDTEVLRWRRASARSCQQRQGSSGGVYDLALRHLSASRAPALVTRFPARRTGELWFFETIIFLHYIAQS